MLDISVNLPTRNRAAFLEKSLASLCAQNLDPARYEICVVNNGSTDDTPGAVARVAARYPHHRLFMVDEPVTGLSRARNCGIRHTSAPLIANCDDDGVVYPDWLPRFQARFDSFDEDVAVVGGEIEPVWGAPKPDWLTPEMMNYLSARSGQGAEARFLGPDGYCLEGNSCYRRAWLERVGLFPENLGRVGDSLLSGEGILEAHIRHLGGRFFYDPAIILRHYIHAERLTPLWLLRRYFWQGISSYVGREYQRKNAVPLLPFVNLNLPIAPSDWSFVSCETAPVGEATLNAFKDLGFVLALSGILPVET